MCAGSRLLWKEDLRGSSPSVSSILQQPHRQLPSKSTTSDGVIRHQKVSCRTVSKEMTHEKPGPCFEAKQRSADTETTQCPVQNKEKRLIFAPFHTREELHLNQFSQSHSLWCSLKVLIGLPAKGGVCIRNADDTVKSSGPRHLDDVNDVRKPKWITWVAMDHVQLITYFSLSSIFVMHSI